ncbi:MAG: HK97 family phage prohead protease [Beijerinckiaceae bacterium]
MRADLALRPPEMKFGGAPLAKVTVDGAFEGYASLFCVVDLGRDLVLPGAFRDCLSRRPASAIKLLWQHDPGQPLGSWREINEDATGLLVRGQLDLSLAKAREAHRLMRSGAVDGLSIGFRTEVARPDPVTGVRRLARLDLWEVSIVTFPMLPGARVAAVKRVAATPPPLAQDIRRAARRLAVRSQTSAQFAP